MAADDTDPPANTPQEGDEDEERVDVEAAREDPTRFAKLYEANVDRVFAFAARRVGSRVEAEDVTSETFRKALAGLPKFEWRGKPFISWLYRIAANEIADRRVADHRRGEDRTGRSVPSSRSPGEAGGDVGGFGGDRGGSFEPTIQRDLEQASRRSCVERSIEELPADQRRVVLLRFFEERTIRDVARELQRTEGAVKQLQLRALERLRESCHEDAPKRRREKHG